MLVPPVSHHAWNDILVGKLSPKLEFFAAKILLTRLVLLVKRDPATVPSCAKELQGLFVANAHLPSAQRDVAKICGL